MNKRGMESQERARRVPRSILMSLFALEHPEALLRSSCSEYVQVGLDYRRVVVQSWHGNFSFVRHFLFSSCGDSRQLTAVVDAMSAIWAVTCTRRGSSPHTGDADDICRTWWLH